ncbi:transposase [Nocardia xishanensis]|uniref:Transposase n=1 Tax=Nocardia xishanensis TaxID=238964 RepID=A0ABW7XCH4_9NOCA
MGRAWVGVGIGKEHHHAVVIDHTSKQLLSRRVANDENALSRLIDDVAGIADEIDWAVDIVGAESALLLALLHSREQRVCYISRACRSIELPTVTEARARPTRKMQR